MEKSAVKFGKLPSDIKIVESQLNNPYAEFIKQNGVDNNRLILYFHGGGYVMGSSRSHRHIVTTFVKESGINALTFEYRLAPKNPFPAGLDDSIKFAEKAKNSGVEVTVQVGKGMVHCYPTLSPFFPEAKKALQDICCFIKSNINNN